LKTDRNVRNVRARFPSFGSQVTWSVLAVVAVGCDSGKVNRSYAQLEVTPKSIDFGTVDVGSPAIETPLMLKNSGNLKLSITRFVLEGDSTGTFELGMAPPLTLVADESAPILVRLRPSAVGSFGATIHIESDADNAPVLDLSVGARVVAAGLSDAGSVDGGLADAGADDAGVTVDGGSGTIDAGTIDAGTIDAGTIDAGLDSGCLGTWRFIPSLAMSNRYDQIGRAPYFQGGVYLFEQEDWLGRYLPPFEYRVGANAGAMIPLPAEVPAVAGECNVEVVGTSLIHSCWTGLNRFDLSTRTWSPGTKSPSDAPQPGPTRLALASGNTLAVFGSPRHARYDLSSDTWSLLSDAGAPSASISGGMAAGNELVLFNDSASHRDGVFVYALDVGTWRSFDIASPDGGVMHLFAGARLGGTLVLFGQRYAGVSPTPWEAFEVNIADGGARRIEATGAVPSLPWNSAPSVLLSAGQRAVALIPPTPGASQAPTNTGWVFDLDGGVWSVLGGEHAGSRVSLVVSSSGDTVYSLGGAPVELALDGGVAKTLVFSLPPSSTDWVAQDQAPLGIPVHTYQPGLRPSLAGSDLRDRALLFTAPGGMFDPVSLSWEPLPPWPSTLDSLVPRRGLSVANGDKIHVVGSIPGVRGATLESNNTWSTWGSDGGVSSPSTPPVSVGTDVVAWDQAGAFYSPTSGIWSPIGAIPPSSARSYATLAPAGTDKLFAWGGYDGSSYVAGGAVYDRTTTQWTVVSTSGATAAVQRAGSFWTGTEVLVIGGLQSSGVANSGFQAYNPTTDVWRTLARPPFTPRSAYGYVALVPTSRGLLGLSSGIDLSLYLPSTNQWRCVNPLPEFSAMDAFSIAVVNGRVVVVGQKQMQTVYATAVLEGL